MDIGKFEDIFNQVDLVFISCGVNDLSRYGKTGNYLANFICEKLSEFSRLYPDTIFIFNSILNTFYDWLDRASEHVNESVFRLSLNLDNVWFLDTHQVFEEVDFEVLDRAHGIHITHLAKRHITPVIGTCILDLLNKSQVTRVHWPLRSHFVRISRSH